MVPELHCTYPVALYVRMYGCYPLTLCEVVRDRLNLCVCSLGAFSKAIGLNNKDDVHTLL